MFERYNHLGSRAYYCVGGDSKKCYMNLSNVLEENPLIEKYIDPAAVLSILMKNYIFAERTLVKGISRSPWMAKPDGLGSWAYAKLPEHGHQIMTSKDIAKKLAKLLYNEFLDFALNKKSVGILLSGGMDSRVVAAVIKKAQLAGDYNGDIVAFTWGIQNSRDVVYAEMIAKRYNWDHVHILLTPELLHENILLAAERGAEYSPVHLHGIKKVADTTGLDGVVAGSFGDNIGRGEYYGEHVTKLPSIIHASHNKFSLLKKKDEHESMKFLTDDVNKSRNIFHRQEEIQYREIEYQKHYWYRQLSPCLSIIDDKIPFYQMFGRPTVFGFMWSLDFKCRNDLVYYHLLNDMPGDLLDIPWARSGMPYLHTGSYSKDNYKSLHNEYGKWLRNDCRSFILEHLLNVELQKLGIFNDKALKMWARVWSKSKDPKADRLDEKIAWLASLSIFIKRNAVRGIKENNYSVTDDLALLYGRSYYWFYRNARRIL